jgi:hypothetical protein
MFLILASTLVKRRNGMRRFLLLTSSFPPALTHETPALLALCRHLPAHGWTPSVLSAPSSAPQPRDETLGKEIPSSLVVQRVAARSGADRLSGRLAGLAGFVDLQPPWMDHLVMKGLEMIRGDSPSLIVPLVPSHHLVLAAMKLSGKTGLPMMPFFSRLWRADCLEPFVGGARGLVHSFLEKRAVRASSALAASTEGAAGYFLQKYPGTCPPTHVSENPFDPGRITPAGPIPREEPMRIGWVDALLGVHSPEPVLEGIMEFFRRNPEVPVEVEHAGPVSRSAEGRGKVSFRGIVPWREMPAFLESRHLLLLSLPPAHHSHRCSPGIAADCLRTGRPLMAAAPEGDMSRRLRSLGNAYICEPDPVSVAALLENVFDHWRKRILRSPGDQIKIAEQLDAHGVMSRLARFMDGVAG